jgi:hypothetical protein
MGEKSKFVLAKSIESAEENFWKVGSKNMVKHICLDPNMEIFGVASLLDARFAPADW